MHPYEESKIIEECAHRSLADGMAPSVNYWAEKLWSGVV